MVSIIFSKPLLKILLLLSFKKKRNKNINHSFKNRTGDRLGKGTGSLSHWSNH